MPLRLAASKELQCIPHPNSLVCPCGKKATCPVALQRGDCPRVSSDLPLSHYACALAGLDDVDIAAARSYDDRALFSSALRS